MKTLTKTFIILIIVTFLLWHPVTRKIILVILPLGKNWDDVLFWACLILLVLVAFVKGWVNLPKLINKIEREENE